MNRTSFPAQPFNARAFPARIFSVRLLVVTALLSLTVGCLSDEEKEARRAWAYDLSGEYTEVRDEGERAGSLLIENESSKNDIKVTFSRGALYEGEQAFIDLIKDEDARAALLETLVIGAGEDTVREGLVGGENISDNFGESSKLSVKSATYEANPKRDDAQDANVYWILSAEIENESDELRGALTVHYADRRPKDDVEADEDERVLHTENKAFPVVFKRDAGPIEGEVCADCKSGPSDDEEEEDEEEADDQESDEDA